MPLLTERYRPQKIEDLVGFIPTFSIDEDMPHLLLHGVQGSGKTTLAKIIIRMLNADHIILNASNERGIEVIRQKVIDFASTKSSNNTIKIIMLDEADHLTDESQASLRNVMETYAHNCRFILTANYLNKIKDPLQSRCVLVKFDNIPKEQILNRLEFICKEEKIPYEVDALRKIVNQTGNDIRSAINKIDEFKEGVFLSKLHEQTKLAETIFVLIKQKNFLSARQTYLDSHIDAEQFLHDLYTVIWESTESLDYKKHVTLSIADSYKFLSQSAWKEILVESTILNLIR